MVTATGEARRAELVRRFLELRPVVLATMQAGVPDELRAELSALTSRQLHALAVLPEEGLSMSRLARTLGVTQATASALASRLVAKGLAERAHDGPDRRTVRLTPTAAGRELAWRYLRTQLHAADGVFDRLTDSQARQLLHLLEILANAPPAPHDTAGSNRLSPARPDHGRNQEVAE